MDDEHPNGKHTISLHGGFQCVKHVKHVKRYSHIVSNDLKELREDFSSRCCIGRTTWWRTKMSLAEVFSKLSWSHGPIGLPFKGCRFTNLVHELVNGLRLIYLFQEV